MNVHVKTTAPQGESNSKNQNKDEVKCQWACPSLQEILKGLAFRYYSVSVPSTLYNSQYKLKAQQILTMLFQYISYNLFVSYSREGVVGAGRLWLLPSKPGVGNPKKREARCLDTIQPVHKHQYPLATGHPVPGQHLGQPLSQEEFFW